MWPRPKHCLCCKVTGPSIVCVVALPAGVTWPKQSDQPVRMKNISVVQPGTLRQLMLMSSLCPLHSMRCWSRVMMSVARSVLSMFGCSSLHASERSLRMATCAWRLHSLQATAVMYRGRSRKYTGCCAGKPSNVHMTGTSAAVPEGQLPSKSLTSTPGDPSAEALPGVSQRATSQRATSFVGTADYVAPEVMAGHCWSMCHSYVWTAANLMASLMANFAMLATAGGSDCSHLHSAERWFS